ncbi:hypothetical protein EV361DRAFT_895217 [Lentinula raphanica]|nr:hypothetical protein EV361DRAFT_895217 [Lentinula raphanica]
MLSSTRSGKRSNATPPKSGVHSLNNPSVGRGIRRTPPTIDTNLNSYDRTDPFQAFNVLLKLFSSLSSRIGGCQYRLTPQEHKLSLHLLHIVEPFVGSTPSKRTLITRQPTEILDVIVFHVASRADLLSLALTCSRMHDVVIPRHFDYRVVKCRVSSISVWNHLSVHRSLAMNVRRLEVLDERVVSVSCSDNANANLGTSNRATEMVPGGISSTETDLEDTDDELGMHEKHERYLLNALVKMTHLESFVWSCNHSPISIDVLWPVLLRCHTLEEVQINDNMVFSPAVVEEAEAEAGAGSSSNTVARRLKVVSLKSTRHAYGSVKHPDFTRVKGMLNDCPNLQSLDISYTQPRSLPQTHLPADDLFLFGRWPNLTSLTLTNLRCSSATSLSAASTFLCAHAHLETLHLELNPGSLTGHGHKLIFEPNSLPRLRELRAHRDLVSALLACPSDVPRPLEIIKGVQLSSEVNPAFFSNLRQFGVHVKRIELTSWNEMDDIRRLIDSVPRLSWLDLGKKGYGRPVNNGRSSTGISPGGKHSSSSTSYTPTVNVNEWATLLSAAPELTTFHGIRFFYEISPQAQTSLATSSSSGNNTMMNSVSSGSGFGLSTDRSRIRKNDETASVLAWRCPRLRRVDHWEDGGGKVIVIVKDGEGKEKDKGAPRWEVRRIKQ